ncbi:MAG: sigma-70 family RNA polymerase sigma factor [Gemmatimonadaceae bacterium]
MPMPGDLPGPQASTPPDVTALLISWSSGEQSAADRLIPAVYEELHRQAARALRRESDGHSLQVTGLVHEAYLRLVDQRRVQWRNRSQFFGLAAEVMRRVLVDHARAKLAVKRGGGMQRLTLDEAADVSTGGSDAEILALHDALDRLALLDPHQARLVELRYFGGMTIEETADALDISPATVKREWVLVRAWLRRELDMS